MTESKVDGVNESDSTAELAATDPGPIFEMHSLRPAYSSTNHELYFGYLQKELNKSDRKKKRGEEAITGEDLRPRNIALTGSYGSGKSSVLGKVVDEFGDRVVSVSLSTLGSEDSQVDPNATKDPLKTPPITNAIQKEIVKQLLYREKPSNVPGSRYRRIEGFRKARAFGFSLLIAAGITALAFLTGATARVEKLLGDELGYDLAIYLGLFVLLTFMAQGVQALFHNRVWIERLTSGPASISLTNKTESFFDKYLDEIVYFFEANTYDIVIFEDLDRFNDPYIFETLRELNILLNNSKQIDPKIITFVYAIKDSIFEQLGLLSINGVKLTPDEVRQLAVTNRTKFFDVVIPVVPFISHRNARDLVSTEMKSSGFNIGKPLIDLVAKHMVDMRLIKNVHNEFGVFHQKILGPSALDELKPEPLFAMVVYKNLNMADFEKVKEGTSKLDDVHADFRLLVNSQIASADRAIRIAQARLRKLDAIEKRSQALGDQLEEYVARLLRHAGLTLEKATLTLSAAVTTAELREARFWKTWLSAQALELTVSYPATVNINYYGQQNVTQSLALTLADVRTALKDSLVLEEWEAADAKANQKSIDEYTELRAFLKSATMEQVAERDDLTFKSDQGVESFAAIAERHLGKGLALDLLKSGYIDRNYSLYVSLYYDETVTARARNYILHTVETGTIDVNAEIGSGPEIEALLDEAGDAIFADRSIYNIQLLDHLLAKGDARLDRSMRLIAADGDNEREIRSAYFSNGSEVESLVKKLAPWWPSIFSFLLTDDSVAEGQRIALIDAALSVCSDKVTYDADVALGEFVQSHYLDLTTLTGSRQVDSPETVIAVLKNAQVRVSSLKALSEELKIGAIQESLYELNEPNVTLALGGEANLSLDNIGSIDENVFRFVGENLDAYLNLKKLSKGTRYTIDDYKKFVSVLNKIVDADSTDLKAVVQGASSVTVVKLVSLNEKLWPIVAETGHLKTSYENIAEYVARRGQIDDELGATLNASDAISDLETADEPGRRALALTILESGAVANEKRVKLAKSLDLASPLLISELRLEDDDPGFIGLFLEAGLIEDSAEAFGQLASASWPMKRAYIASSVGFSSYVGEVEFSATDFAALVQDSLVSEEVKRAVLLNLGELEDSLSRVALDALAAFAIGTGTAVGPDNLLTMATAGVASTSLIQLISLEIASLSIEDLLAILRVMPDKYKKLTTAGGSTKIPNTAEDIQLADHLVRVGQVSSRDAHPSGGQFKVNLKAHLPV